ncbi:MAG TPA: T9SS type A sorting domain-containing protein [Rhodothermales bacterium]|nr:T9SS type A sorting domain-containing protein [Rhodothermales bacterium]
MKWLPIVLILLFVASTATAQEEQALPLAGSLVERAASLTAAPTVHPLSLADTTITYDTGSVPSVLDDQISRPEAYDVGAEARQANRFVKPEDGTLISVAVAPYYLNDFAGSTVPDSIVRNFRLSIWAHADSLPGAELFGLDLEDSRANGTNGQLNFLELDTLQFYQDELATLPDTFYIGLSNMGDDDNYLVMGVTEYDPQVDVDSVAFLFSPDFYEGQSGWRVFADLSSQVTGLSLADRVLPIRATFSRDETVASEDADEVPERIALSQNYPNPFNPTTTIAFALPQTAPVRLAVYDVLGREVAVLIDGVQPAGTHQVQVDARRWSSGMYFYTLEANGQQQTHRMVLVK